jgi:hypothetical protein
MFATRGLMIVQWPCPSDAAVRFSVAASQRKQSRLYDLNATLVLKATASLSKKSSKVDS